MYWLGWANAEVSDSVKCCREFTESGEFCPATVTEPTKNVSTAAPTAGPTKSTPIPDSAFKEFDEFYFDVDDGVSPKSRRRR